MSHKVVFERAQASKLPFHHFLITAERKAYDRHENHLSKSFCKISGLPRAETKRVVETFFEILKQNLEKGEDILVSGFGKFCVKEKKPRKGRDPQTGEDMMLDGRRVVTFRCSSVLREKVNG